jgi:hypothetical protein
MPWSAGTFSRANGATGWQDDQAANIGIEAGRHDTQDNDFRNGINETINKAGQNTPTANLPMGGFKHTGVANAAASSEYAAYGQVQAGVNVQSTTLDWTATQYSNDATAAKFVLQKSRGATTGSNVIVNNSDYIGSLEFRGNNGTTFSTAAQIIVQVDGAPGASADMPGAILFATSPDASATPVERMRVTSNGDVCIGNTALNNAGSRGIITQGAAANQVVEIIGTAIGNDGSSYVQVKGTNSGNTRTAEFGVTKPTANSNPCAYMRLTEDDNGANYLWVSNAGNLMISNTYANIGTATGTVVGTQTSDERLKNIKPTPFQYGLQQILALTPVEYELKDEPGKNKLGFIAQQTAPILPETVFNTGDIIPNEDVKQTKLGMDYSQIIPVLVKAIQQLEARIVELEGA